MLTRIRRNHAVEHGTVAVLLASGSPTPLGGLATPYGFLVFGKVSRDDVGSAAAEALERLRAGERELAISPYCGTNLVIGVLIAGAITALVARRSTGRLRHMRAAALGMMGAALLRGPVGSAVQRHLTTLAQVGGMEIGTVRSLPLGGYSIHFVSTS